MRIDSIHLVNYRCHKDLKVDFQSSFNVIVAVNGGGKTSLLNAVVDALAPHFNSFGQNYHAGLDSEIPSVRTQATAVAGRYRFEEMYPQSLRVQGKAGGIHDFTWEVRKTNAIGQASLNHDLGALDYFNQLRSAHSAHSFPIVSFYRANRQWPVLAPDAIQAALKRNSRLDAYASWWNASQDLSLQSWIIAKCLERTQTASELGTKFDDVEDDELALANIALRLVLEGSKGLKYDMKRNALLVEWRPGTGRASTVFDNLSDGQRSIVFLVTDIARRICLLNPHLGAAALTETTGIVLIDELDVHLHPHWQRVLVRGLKSAFPGIQFIIATHSPQILGELQPDEIIVLHRDGYSQPQVSYGLTSTQVLQEIMGTESRTPRVEKGLESIFNLLERGELEQARAEIAALESVAAGVPELERARAALQRREILGR